MFDEILVPTDGSDCAEEALGYAEDLATRYDATVHALCVVDSRSLDNAPHLDRARETSATIVSDACERLSRSGLPTEDTVQTGVPHRVIRAYAADHDIDLVVMGTHGRTGVERYLLGSVTEKVICVADVPVLTVTPREDGSVTYPYSDVLVPTDGSDGAAAAIPPAIDVASRYGARLHGLSVVDTTATGLDVRSELLRDSLERVAETALGIIEDEASDAGFSAVETAIEYGSPHREIETYVEEHDVGLIVVGTHGRSGLDRYLIGSVAERVVRTSPVPVMTVPAGWDQPI